MTDARAPVLAYDSTTIRLHWATAALVVVLWSVAQVIDFFPVGPARWNVRSAHMVLGLALGGILVWRLWWRATRGRHLQPVAGALAATRKAIHASLYLLVAGDIVLGLLNAWVRGDQVFTSFKISPLVIAGLDLRHRVGDLHALGANVLLTVAGLHAAAALIHHYVLRDNTMARMLLRRTLR